MKQRIPKWVKSSSPVLSVQDGKESNEASNAGHPYTAIQTSGRVIWMQQWSKVTTTCSKTWLYSEESRKVFLILFWYILRLLGKNKKNKWQWTEIKKKKKRKMSWVQSDYASNVLSASKPFSDNSYYAFISLMRSDDFPRKWWSISSSQHHQSLLKQWWKTENKKVKWILKNLKVNFTRVCLLCHDHLLVSCFGGEVDWIMISELLYHETLYVLSASHVLQDSILTVRVLADVASLKIFLSPKHRWEFLHPTLKTLTHTHKKNNN